MTKSPTSPTTPTSLSENDAVLAALQHSAAMLDNDAAAVPTAAYQQRARLELLQAVATTGPITPLERLQGGVSRWGHLFDRRRLVGLGLGAALFGMVAVPAFAAPSSVVGRMTGAVGAAIADVPALFAGVPPAASSHASDKDTPTAIATRSAVASDGDTQLRGLGATVSTIARSTAEQGEAHGDAVSSAAHSIASTVTADTDTRGAAASRGAGSDGLAGRATSTSSAEADSHGDAVSAVAHTPPPVGENHGQQVSSIARGITTRTVTATSTPGAEQHGVAVSAVAHSTSPTSENHGQQVSSVARGVTTTTSTPVAAANEAAQGGKGNGAGTPPANGQGGSDKSHGR